MNHASGRMQKPTAIASALYPSLSLGLLERISATFRNYGKPPWKQGRPIHPRSFVEVKDRV
jgi:hypothetical protein